MLALLYRVVPVLLLVAIAAAILPSTPRTASLTGDAGLDEASVCSAVAANGANATQRLDASGFPHATTSRVELYRLVRDDGLRLEANGTKTRVMTIEAQIRIDWAAHTAACLPNSYAGPADATLVLTPHAYASLIDELRHVLETGRVGFLSPGRWISLASGTSVTIPGNEPFEGAYKREVAAWTAGAIATGAWRGSNA